MSLDFIVDYPPEPAHTFRLAIYHELKHGGCACEVKWIGAEAARDPQARERIAREMLDSLCGSPPSIEDVAKACLVIREAGERCA